MWERHVTVSSANQRQVVLSCIGKQTKQTMGTSQLAEFLHDFCIDSYLVLLPWLLSVMEYHLEVIRWN